MAVRSLENRAGGPVARSEEPSAPLPVAVGTAEPGASMKTTFTIEIKDGRGQASTGRVLLPTGNQRAGRPPLCLPAAGGCLPVAAQLRTQDMCRGQGSGCLQRVRWERGAPSAWTGNRPHPCPASDPDGRPSPPPELTLGLRAPPALLSTSSGGKSTFTHISSPGNLARLGSVTHVTSFSPASLGSRGGCSRRKDRRFRGSRPGSYGPREPGGLAIWPLGAGTRFLPGPWSQSSADSRVSEKSDVLGQTGEGAGAADG